MPSRAKPFIKVARKTKARRNRMSVMSRAMSTKVHRFHCTSKLTDILFTAADQIQVVKPMFNWLNNYNEFAAMYDQYSIRKVKLSYYPMVTEAQMVNSATAGYAMGRPVCSALTKDAYPVPLTFGDFLEFGNLKRHQAFRKFSITWKPNVLTNLYSSVSTTTFSSKSNAWLDTQNSQVEHFGCFLHIPGIGTSTTSTVIDTVRYEVFVEYDLLCRCTR